MFARSCSALVSCRRACCCLLSCSSSALGSRRRPSLGVLSCLVVRFGGAGGLKPRSLTQKATWEFPSCLLEIPQGPLVADVAASAWAWSCRDCPVLPPPTRQARFLPLCLELGCLATTTVTISFFLSSFSARTSSSPSAEPEGVAGRISGRKTDRRGAPATAAAAPVPDAPTPGNPRRLGRKRRKTRHLERAAVRPARRFRATGAPRARRRCRGGTRRRPRQSSSRR